MIHGQTIKYNIPVTLTLIIFTALIAPASALPKIYWRTPAEFEKLVEKQTLRSQKYLLDNLSPNDGLPGAVLASPSRENPNYYFHWVRDAAIVMNTVLSMPELGHYSRQSIERRMRDYAAFSKSNQISETLTGLGEPKFYVNGESFNGPWGRPQNDGPALRAITLTRWAQTLLQNKSDDGYVTSTLYDPKSPSGGIIKTDLEYVAHHWQDKSWDVWEEVLGDHFYNRIVSAKALLEGSHLASRLGDLTAARFYSEQASNIMARLHEFYKTNRYVTTLNRLDGANYKHSQVDSVQVLALLHGPGSQGFVSAEEFSQIFGQLSFGDEKVIITVQNVVETFRTHFEINRNGRLGVALGRYPEDKYDGLHTDKKGNPWFISTLAAAQFYYLMAKQIKEGMKFHPRLLKEFAISQSLSPSKSKPLLVAKIMAHADGFLARCLVHMNQESGRMSEQFHHSSGYMQGAHDLTWSYSAWIAAVHARQLNLKAKHQ